MIKVQTPLEIQAELEEEGVPYTMGEVLSLFLERLQEAINEHDGALEAARQGQGVR